MNYQYKFSVIMPIFNTEQYLKDSIGSILLQTIGFEDNIQLILVNDGSTDSCASICQNYQKKFPNNIICINQDNQGVSQARNAGISLIQGKYINFFDSDDRWSENAFQKVWDFFESHSEEIDVVTCIQKFFEAKSGYHKLSNKFKNGDKIIDINETPHFILLSVTSTFIKAVEAKNHKFDARISVGEDSRYITEIILNKEKYGVLSSVEYYIRKRNAKTSLTQNPKLGRYTDTVEHYYKYLPQLSIKKYGKVIPYIEHILINGLKYRVLSDVPNFLNDKEKDTYINNIIELVKTIGDTAIAKTVGVSFFVKLYLFQIKYGSLSPEDIQIQKQKLFYKNNFIGNIQRKLLIIERLSIRSNECTISGLFRSPFAGNQELLLQNNDISYPIKLCDDSDLNKIAFNGDILIQGRRFKVTFELNKKVSRVSFILKQKNNTVILIPAYRNNLSKLKNSYLHIRNKMLLINKKGTLIIKRYSLLRALKYHLNR